METDVDLLSQFLHKYNLSSCEITRERYLALEEILLNVFHYLEVKWREGEYTIGVCGYSSYSSDTRVNALLGFYVLLADSEFSNYVYNEVRRVLSEA